MLRPLSFLSLEKACSAVLLCVAFGLCACTSTTPSLRTATALNEAEKAGFIREITTGSEFNLTTLHRGLGRSTFLTVYIEGDGHAWKRPTTPSSDPTPHDPIGLKLALKDPGTSVLYIARPCQFSNDRGGLACNSKHWTTHRYSEEVVNATRQVIESAISDHWDSVPDYVRPGVGLIGYSGGGTLAALVAAHRADISWLVTVAANLDHETWTKGHGVTPLTGSLNPVEFADQLARVPQLHLRGEQDAVVPAAVVENFVDRVRSSGAEHVRVQVIPTFQHGCCWDAIWPGPLSDFLDSLP